jgi:hypothetical protein
MAKRIDSVKKEKSEKSKKEKRKEKSRVISNRARFAENLPIFFFVSEASTVATAYLASIPSLPTREMSFRVDSYTPGSHSVKLH